MSTSSDRLKRAEALLDALPPSQISERPEVDPTIDGVSDEEALALRQEKLAAIRKAIDAGAYDSDQLLEKAMNRMREAIEGETDSA